jgi:hypothetical protein
VFDALARFAADFCPRQTPLAACRWRARRDDSRMRETKKKIRVLWEEFCCRLIKWL